MTEPRWLVLEAYLDDGVEVSVQELGEVMMVDTAEASLHIQAYLDAQFAKNSKTQFCLHRVEGTRTANARWVVGTKRRDIRAVSKGLHLDFENRIERAYYPTIRRIAQDNPRAAQVAREQMEMIGHALRILELAVAGQLPPEDPQQGS